jgi:hypothetical protein
MVPPLMHWMQLTRDTLEEVAGREAGRVRSVARRGACWAIPEQVHGRAGDLLLAHYLLGHNIGGNTSDTVRRTVYFRVKRVGHAAHWRQFLQDAWLDYDAVRGVLV